MNSSRLVRNISSSFFFFCYYFKMSDHRPKTGVSAVWEQTWSLSGWFYLSLWSCWSVSMWLHICFWVLAMCIKMCSVLSKYVSWKSVFLRQTKERYKLEALKKKQEQEEERMKKMEEEKKKKQEELKRLKPNLSIQYERTVRWSSPYFSFLSLTWHHHLLQKEGREAETSVWGQSKRGAEGGGEEKEDRAENGPDWWEER